MLAFPKIYIAFGHRPTEKYGVLTIRRCRKEWHVCG
jgi:hypothetical protein